VSDMFKQGGTNGLDQRRENGSKYRIQQEAVWGGLILLDH
jgi:hypothetical protein